MKRIALRHILVLHEYEINTHGGSSGVRDMGMLESAIHRPFATFDGEDLYPHIMSKASALIQSIVKNHPFVDGNKRTAFTSTYIFLKENKFQIKATQRAVVKFIVSVANKNLSVDEIASWLISHSVNIN